jgi:hypothetical protein
MASPLHLTLTSPLPWHRTCVSFSNGAAPRKGNYVAQSLMAFLLRKLRMPSEPISVLALVRAMQNVKRGALTIERRSSAPPPPSSEGHAALAHGSILEDREDRFCHLRLDKGALKHVPRERPDGGECHPLQAHERETVATVSSTRIRWHASTPDYMHSSLHALLASFEMRHGGE